MASKPPTANPTIPDDGLFLGVLQTLLEQEVITEEALTDALADVAPADPERDDDEAERAAAAVRLLHGLRLPVGALARVTGLDFDGGNDVYMLLEDALDIDTGGEEDYYQVESLRGIAALTSLTSLDLDGHGFRQAQLDLSPLNGHPTLAAIVLTGVCTHAAALETLPALKKLTAAPHKLDDPAVLDRLARRGVEVIRQ